MHFRTISVIEAQFSIREGYIGCFKDNSNNRDLAHQLSNNGPSMTVEACTKQCSTLYYR